MEGLNKEQFMASRGDGGISLVIAGAGTGKTKTLVEKIKNIIITGIVAPENILVLTFSKKAALEIKERVVRDIKDKADAITAGTFHSFCLSILKYYKKDFIESEDFKMFPKVIGEDEKSDIFNKIIASRLHEFRGIPIPVIREMAETPCKINETSLKGLNSAGILTSISLVNTEFLEKKKKLCFIEFEDMIDFTISLFEQRPDIRADVLCRYKYILVDEFQDTSDNNVELIKYLLPEKNKNLFAVGDDWQSIYGFRDARVEYIINIKKYFPEVDIHRLKINYRSKKEIVKLSSKFVCGNKNRTKKKLISHRGKGANIKVLFVGDIDEEAELISDLIKKSSSVTNDIAVIYRNNFQGDYLRSIITGPFADNIEAEFITMHRSKGLEFHTVIIAGVSDKIIPDKKSCLEEERRLFYVALSRAKDNLFIICHKNKNDELPRCAKELKLSTKHLLTTNILLNMND